MVRLYLTLIVVVFIISLHKVNSFFLEDVTNLPIPRNITCQLNNNTKLPGDFQFCAIRNYSSLNGSDQMVSFIVYNGLRYTNTFRRFIKNKCSDFPDNWDTSIGTCNALPFELFETMTICICATDNCNKDFDTCQKSVNSSMIASPASDFIPILSSIISCNNALDTFDICTEHPYIDVPSCQDYVRDNSVLCTITVNDTDTVQTSLIDENYEAFLTEVVYQAKSVTNNNPANLFNETNTNVYYKYVTDGNSTVEECVCVNSSCNQNILTCAPQLATLVDTATATSPSTNATFDSAAVNSTDSTVSPIDSTTIAAFNSIGVNLTDSTFSLTDSTTITTFDSTAVNSTDSTFLPTSFTTITTFDSTGVNLTDSTFSPIDSTTITTFDSTGVSSTDLITTTISTMTPTFTSSTTTTSADSTTTPTSKTTQGSIVAVATSSNGQSPVIGEPGFGSAATAGLACGIIFSALIFTAEIIFFKFFYNGGLSDRSVTYRA